MQLAYRRSLVIPFRKLDTVMKTIAAAPKDTGRPV
jgi:hypothetical protein